MALIDWHAQEANFTTFVGEGPGDDNTVAFDLTHNDHDRWVCSNITREAAQEIITALTNAFNLTPEPVVLLTETVITEVTTVTVI